MKMLKAPFLCAVGLIASLTAFSAHAQDCLTAGPQDFYVDKDDASSSDSNNGHYRQDGGTGPLKTIQRLVDILQPGQCGFVRKSATPYYENTYRAGDFWGVTFTRGGTSDSNRIIVAGYPGEKPVLDQRRAAPAGTQGNAVVGIYVYAGSYITIRNIEVLGSQASGIMVMPESSESSGIVIENNHVHDLPGTGNPNNRGGIRIDSCNYCIVRNNTIHDIGDDDASDGVNGFQPGSGIIENNLIYNVALGVQLKQADKDHLNAHIVRNNIFVNIGDAVYKMQLQGAASLPSPRNSQFYNNVVYNAQLGVWADLSEAGEQATVLKIYNNTFINTAKLASIANFSGIEVYNNIYSGWTNSYTSSQGFIFNTANPGPWVNQISYFDNNLYYNLSEKWEIETYNSPVTYASLATWRTATRDVTQPDVHSSFANPLFATTATASSLIAGRVSDLNLPLLSAALTMGRNGDAVGAVRPGVVIGPSSVPVSTLVPKAPPTLSIQ